MVLLLLGTLFQCLALDFFNPNAPDVCIDAPSLSSLKIENLIGKRFFINFKSFFNLFEIGQCMYSEFQDLSIGKVNFTLYYMDTDGMHYGSDYILELYTNPENWGEGKLQDSLGRVPFPFEFIETDWETYYVLFYCKVGDSGINQFEIHSIYRDFDVTPFLHYAYDRGFVDEKLGRVEQSEDVCGDFFLRNN